VAFPIFEHGAATTIMEFFSNRPEIDDDGFLSVMTDAGHLIA